MAYGIDSFLTYIGLLAGREFLVRGIVFGEAEKQ
jgi:hypothetical protein